MKVLHYKSNFLNRSETFIDRLLRNHNRYEPVGMCIDKRHYADHLPVYQKPQSGFSGLLNTVCFHLNLTLPYYRSVVEKEHPRIIHAHFGFDGYRMYELARKSNIPLVVSFYGSDVSRLPTEFDWKRRYKNLALYADGFIAASKLMKSQLVDLGFPAKNIEVIRFGINLSEFTYKQQLTSGAGVMMVGRMVEKKGFQYALKAIKILAEKGQAIHLDIYGDGPLREKLNTMVSELGIASQVHFHGYVSNEKVRQELQNHSILLAPSVTASDDDKEGLPNTILEAMASGIPVVASRHAAIPEAITDGKTGLLVPEKEPEAIAAALSKLLKQQVNVDQLRLNARKFIEQHHSIDQLVNKTEKFYTEIIKAYEEK